MPYTVGPKGQVVIAKEIRQRLGILPGWVTLQRIVGDHVELYFLPPEHRRSLMGSLSGHIHTSVGTGAAWQGARDAAWHEAAAGRERGSAQERAS